MKKWKQLLSLQLVLCMALILLPTTAMASAVIESFNVWIDEPKAGEKFDFTAETDSDECTVGNVYWYDLTSGEQLDSNAVAQGSQRYEVKIKVDAVSGYRIVPDTVGLINGYQSVYESGYLRTSFTAAEIPVAELIHAVELELDAPIPGAKADFSAVCGDRSYTLSGQFDDLSSSVYTQNGVQWVDMTTEKVMTASDTFAAGHTYRAIIHLKANNNYEFYYDATNPVPPVAAVVNGVRAGTAKAYERDPLEEIDIICDFTCDYQAISAVGINGLDAPGHGKTPDYTAELESQSYTFKATSAGNPFVVNGVSWYDESTGTSLTSTGKFMAGHTYSVTVYLVPAENAPFAGAVNGSINGYSAEVTGSSREITVKYTFQTLPLNKITSVAVEGITAPATGKFPSYVAIVRGEGYQLEEKNDYYYKNGIGWCYLEGSNLPTSQYTFEGEQTYEVYIYLTPEEGYTFDAQNLRATVNGNAAHDIYAKADQVILVYRYPTPTASIMVSNVAIEGITVPYIGEKPDYTAVIRDTRYGLLDENTTYTKNGIQWKKDGNAMATHATFEVGHTYSVVIGVAAADGFNFGREIPGTINGKTAELIYNDGSTNYYEITFGEALEHYVSGVVSDADINTVTIVVTGNGQAPGSNLYIAVYDENGRMIGIEKAVGQNLNAEGKSYTVSFSSGLADSVGLFLLDSNGRPYDRADSVEIS